MIASKELIHILIVAKRCHARFMGVNCGMVLFSGRSGIQLIIDGIISGRHKTLQNSKKLAVLKPLVRKNLTPKQFCCVNFLSDIYIGSAEKVSSLQFSGKAGLKPAGGGS